MSNRRRPFKLKFSAILLPAFWTNRIPRNTIMCLCPQFGSLSIQTKCLTISATEYVSSVTKPAGICCVWCQDSYPTFVSTACQSNIPQVMRSHYFWCSFWLPDKKEQKSLWAEPQINMKRCRLISSKVYMYILTYHILINFLIYKTSVSHYLVPSCLIHVHTSYFWLFFCCGRA